MAKIKVSKCDECGRIFEDESKYAQHLEEHRVIKEIDAAFPPVEDHGCRFANGGYPVQRSREWLEGYKALILQNSGVPGDPFSYGWFRVMDDGDHFLYRYVLRVLCVCPKCFREWGQPYYANHCDCKGGQK